MNGQPSPARYALGSYDGTLMVETGVFASYKPIEEVAIGAGVSALVGYYQTNVIFSASPQGTSIPKRRIAGSSNRTCMSCPGGLDPQFVARAIKCSERILVS